MRNDAPWAPEVCTASEQQLLQILVDYDASSTGTSQRSKGFELRRQGLQNRCLAGGVIPGFEGCPSSAEIGCSS